MRALIRCFGGLLLASAAPAWANESGTYVGVDAGVTLSGSYPGKFTEPFGTVNEFRIGHKTGVDVNAVVGHTFGAFRIEGELGWKRNPTQSGRGADDADSLSAEGSTSSLSVMANALLAVPVGRATLFAGPGVGWSRNTFKYREALEDDGDYLVNESSSRFAWQVQAGAEYPLSDSVKVAVKYRYFETRIHFDDAETNPDDTNVFRINSRAHSVLAGIRLAL